MNCLGNWGADLVSKCLMFERGDLSLVLRIHVRVPIVVVYDCDSNTGEEGIGGFLGLAGQPVWWLLVDPRHVREPV